MYAYIIIGIPLTWTLCSLIAEGMISDPKSLDVGYFHFKSLSKTSFLNT